MASFISEHCFSDALETYTMNRSIRLFVTTIAAISFAALLPACNTVKGAGKDIQQGAESTEKAIDNATK